MQFKMKHEHHKDSCTSLSVSGFQFFFYHLKPTRREKPNGEARLKLGLLAKKAKHLPMKPWSLIGVKQANISKFNGLKIAYKHIQLFVSWRFRNLGIILLLEDQVASGTSLKELNHMQRKDFF